VNSDLTATDGAIVSHRLRHAFATALLSGGMSVVNLMAVLGHRDHHMTMRYAAITQETVHEEYAHALSEVAARRNWHQTSSDGCRTTPTTTARQGPSSSDWTASIAGSRATRRARTEIQKNGRSDRIIASLSPQLGPRPSVDARIKALSRLRAPHAFDQWHPLFESKTPVKRLHGASPSPPEPACYKHFMEFTRPIRLTATDLDHHDNRIATLGRGLGASASGLGQAGRHPRRAHPPRRERARGPYGAGAGHICYEAAALIARVGGPVNVHAWIERATQRTVRQLREDIDATELLARLEGRSPTKLDHPMTTPATPSTTSSARSSPRSLARRPS